MDTRLHRLFLDVARAGSFAAVARERDTDPSSISRQIATLEAELGCRVFDRTTRRLALTEPGALLAERLAAPLDELDATLALARDIVAEPQGTLRVGASVAFGERWLVRRLGAFRERYPKIVTELLLDDAVVDPVAARLDLAIRLGSAIEGPVVITRLMDTRYRVVAAPGYLDSAPRLETPDDLSCQTCIVFPQSGYRSSWRFRSRDASRTMCEVEIRPSQIVSNALAIRRAALDGQGLALLPDWCIDDALGTGTLRDALPGWEATARDFDTAAWLLYPTRSYLPHKTRALIDWLKASVDPTPGSVDP